jgi:hypothetical protein
MAIAVWINVSANQMAQLISSLKPEIVKEELV